MLDTKTLEPSHVQDALLQMISQSGFLGAAGLTEDDANMRLALDYTNNSVSLDLSDCLEHTDVLVDYAKLYGPAMLGVDLAFIMRNGTDLEIAINLASLDTASDDDDEDDGMEDSVDGDDDETDSDAAASRQESGRLNVLCTPEMHKIANRIYTMIGDSPDMARYAKFLQELDGLLGKYGGLPAQARGKSSDTEDDDEEEASLIDLAFILDETVDELARKRRGGGGKGRFKEGRSGLLSVFMKSMTGAAGEKMQAAWDKKNPEQLREALKSIVNKVVDTLEQFAKSDKKEQAALETADNSDIRPFFVKASLKNGADVLAWMKESGFKSAMSPEHMHVTIAFSREPVNTTTLQMNETDTAIGEAGSGERHVGRLGDNGAVVMHLTEAEAEPFRKRWKYFREQGASWDYDDYRCHMTLSYKDGRNDAELKDIPTYAGKLLFGGEELKELKQFGKDWSPDDIPHVDLEDQS